MWFNMFTVKYYYIFLVYMVDGNVMVTYIPNKVNNFVLLEMNCKIDSLISAKIPYLHINDVMESYHI